jgi:hypothetical protein
MDISHFKSLHDWICSTDTTKVYSTADEENSHLNKALTEKQIEEMSKWTADKDHTEDSVEYRRAKFKQEFNNYFDLEYVLIYYVYTFFALMVDQRAKNMFFTYWEPLLDENGEQIEYNGKKIGGKWQPWFYDNDTCFGIDNEGDLRFDYYHEDDARDGFVF